MTDQSFYLDKFNESAGRLDLNLFNSRKLDIKVGVWLDSVVLKMQKDTWRNSFSDRPFSEGIFFSIWASDASIAEGKLYYNIHALKLRELAGYKIKSRDFAADFRAHFAPFAAEWPNVSISFGPLTLMEGWMGLDEESLEAMIVKLAEQFLKLDDIIDMVLTNWRKP